MLAARLIESMGESDWVSPMVVQEKKKKGERRICVDLRKLNDACVHDLFPTLFIDEVLENVDRQEAYSCTDGFSGYHQIKIALEDRMILNLEAPRSVKQLHTTLGHTWYYRKFIKSYDHITAPMEKLLKKDVTFCFNDDYMKILDVLKEKLASMPILFFRKWDKEFHVHVDASCIALGAVIT
eukprot:PITA_26825